MKNEELAYLVYKHTSPSGKAYIGQTKNYSKRCLQHRQPQSKCLAFAEAIKKYGWDNFHHEILIDGLSLDDANTWEELLIAEHNTISPNGYNLATGGGNSKPSLETIDKITTTKRDFFKEQWILLDPDGVKIIVDDLYLFSLDNGFNYHSLRTCFSKKISFKGFRIYSLEIEGTSGSLATKVWEIISPNGELLTINNLNEFCLNNNLRASSLRTAISTKTTYKGYRGNDCESKSRSKSKMKQWNLTDPDGNQLIIDDLNQFCIDKNLKVGSMRSCLRIYQTYKGYKLQ
jgi:hypothetical protein